MCLSCCHEESEAGEKQKQTVSGLRSPGGEGGDRAISWDRTEVPGRRFLSKGVARFVTTPASENRTHASENKPIT